MVQAIIFLLGSSGIILLSRNSLLKPYSYGFPRFFAFEALLGLVIINASKWFIQPFSLPQIVSWALLIDAFFLAVHAFWTLNKYGAPSHTIQDASRLTIEKTTRLVTEGPYQFIRHPMYSSLLCLAWGVFLKQINLLSGLLVILVSLTFFLTAINEERENLQIFGDQYVTYMQHTKRFIPFVF